MTDNIIRIPAYLSEANDGDTISITRRSVSFDTGKPVFSSEELIGTVSGFQRVVQIPHTYIAAWLTTPDGRKHEIKSRPDFHINLVHRVDVKNIMQSDTSDAVVTCVGSAGVEVSWGDGDGVQFYSWTQVKEYGFSFKSV